MVARALLSLAFTSLLAKGSYADKIRGVNLGGWLVLEPWITPNLFLQANDGVAKNNDGSLQVVDEYTWRSAGTGTLDRQSLLIDHWNTWVTLEHLETLKTAGITHLRIPVGYWYWNTTSDEPFGQDAALFPVALSHLTTLVNDWAAGLGLRVLIDLHTAPGSQNGFDNSGRRGGIDVLQGSNVDRWAQVVATMTQWCVDALDADVLFGIEILNEPAGFYEDIWNAVTTEINPRGYDAVRASNNGSDSSSMKVVFQTAFQPFDSQPKYEDDAHYEGCWFDDHSYQCFGDDWNGLATDPAGWPTHLAVSCENAAYYGSAPGLPAFVGEFSLAVTDCALFLSSGINAGCDLAQDPSCLYVSDAERLSGSSALCDYYTAPPASMPAEYRDFLKNFARAQMDSFEAADGWFFWNFRTEDGHAPEWDYLLGWEQGWMPANASAPEPFCASAAAKAAKAAAKVAALKAPEKANTPTPRGSGKRSGRV